jgi:hypothetical protein
MCTESALIFGLNDTNIVHGKMNKEGTRTRIYFVHDIISSPSLLEVIPAASAGIITANVVTVNAKKIQMRSLIYLKNI